MQCDGAAMAQTEESQARKPLILEIKGNSLDDGPGIRTVVFFKGCPLSCSWCHNPESKRARVEIGYDRKECIGCGTCTAVCPEKAVSPQNIHPVDREKCTLCFRCVEECPAGALARVGRSLSIDEIAAEVLKDKPFFDTSGGGATFSGGEPVMFMEFLSELLHALKAYQVHTLLETSGFFDFEKFERLLLPCLDMIYYDIKIMDEKAHRIHTGVSNQRILENFERLFKISRDTGITLLPRTPLVPGITDRHENIQGIARFLAELGVRNAALMPYNPLWHEKADKIGADNPHRGHAVMAAWMEKEKVEACRRIFSEEGIQVV
ncbi:MAG: glycyl-radical enzyme activating protein [Smithellaceae bacterium]|jgi:pyruvate formate lyase activating enzyme